MPSGRLGSLKRKLLVYGGLVALPATMLVGWLQVRVVASNPALAPVTIYASLVLLVALLVVPLWFFLQRKILQPVEWVMAADRLSASAPTSARIVPEERLPDHEIGAMIRSRNAMLRQIDAMQSEFRRNLRHLAALSSAAARLADAGEFERFLEQALDRVLDASGADAAHVSTTDPKGQELTVRVCRGFSTRWVRRESTRPMGGCLCGHVLESRQAVAVPELEEDRRVTREACRLEGFRAYVGVPLLCADRAVGVLATLRRDGAFSPQETDTLVAIGYLLGLALENARLLRETRQLALTDALTGIYTRRYFFQRLQDEKRRSARLGRPFAVAMVDLDGFKAYNDRHGHLEGDRVLVQVAARLRETVRESDVVARYGGDEFALLLPETPADEAVAIAERILGALREVALPPPHAGASPETLRASLGVAVCPLGRLEVEELVARADAALYRAKAKGGGCVVLWPVTEAGSNEAPAAEPVAG